MNHILKAVLLATAGTLAVVSAYLTSNFMFTTGEAVGLGSVFAVAGVALDIIKTIAPMAVLIAWSNGKHNAAIAGGVLAIVLTALSIQASYQSIESSVSSMAIAANQSSQESRLLQSRLDSNRLALASTLEQQAVFVAAGMATKAGELNTRIDELNGRIDELASQLSELKTKVKPTLANNGIIVVSMAIELASIIGLVLADTLKPKTNSNSEPVRVQTNSKTITNQTTTSQTISESVTISDYELAIQMVTNRGVNPSERALQAAMRITRKEASQLLDQMEDDGLLEWNGRGRVVIFGHAA